MGKCFICNDPQMPPASVRDLPPQGPGGDNGNSDMVMMRILCQLLRIRWDDVNSSRIRLPLFPFFCASCASGVMDLIRLRGTLVKLETEMFNRIRELQVKIVTTIDEDERGLFIRLEQSQQDSQSIFRKQAFDEYQADELLRLKILESRRRSRDRECDRLRLEDDYLIEIQPSFVQLKFGTSMSMRNKSLFSPTLCQRSNHFTRTSEESSPSIPKMEVVDLGRGDSDTSKDIEEEASDWIENQHGPLTRLRLSGALSKSKVKEGLSEITPRNSMKFEAEIKMEAVAFVEANEFQEDQVTSNIGAGSDFQIDQDNEDEGTDKDDETSDSEPFILAERSSRRKITKLSQTRTRRKIRNRKSASRRQWQVEEFNEIQTNEDGRHFYEGIEIERRSDNGQRGKFFLKCGACLKEINQKSFISQQRSPYRMMQVHIKADHLNAYKCTDCGKILRDYRTLNQHKQKRHSHDGVRVILPPRVFGSSRIPPEVVASEDGRVEFQGVELRRIEREGGDYDVICGICEKLFNKKESRRCKQCPYRQMLNHIKGVHLHSFRCQFCDKIFRNSKTFKIHVSKHSKGREDFKCEICGKPSSGEGYKKKHIWSHKNAEEKEAAVKAGEKGPLTYGDLMKKLKASGPAFQCSECGITFHFAANLRRHEHVHKKEIREHQCAECGKSYCSAERLKSHIKYIHESERVHKKYRCSFCPKWFVTKSPWTKHERTHTKAIPYHCPTCHKGFALKQSLSVHIRNKKCKQAEPQRGSALSVQPKQRKKQKKELGLGGGGGGLTLTWSSTNEANTESKGPSFQSMHQVSVSMGAPLPAHQNNLPSSTGGGPSVSFPYAKSLDSNYTQKNYDSYVYVSNLKF